jgi:hypothetical protein
VGRSGEKRRYAYQDMNKRRFQTLCDVDQSQWPTGSKWNGRDLALCLATSTSFFTSFFSFCVSPLHSLHSTISNREYGPNCPRNRRYHNSRRSIPLSSLSTPSPNPLTPHRWVLRLRPSRCPPLRSSYPLDPAHRRRPHQQK